MNRSSVIALFSCILVSLCASSLAQTCQSYTFANNAVYSSCSDLGFLNSYLHWNYSSSAGTVDIAFRQTSTSTSRWAAWALNPTQPRMAGSQALVAYQNSSGAMYAYTTPITNTSPSMTEGSLSFPVTNLNATYANAEIIIYATLTLTSNLLSTNQVWQEGPLSGGVPAIHAMNSANQNSVGTINFQSGQTGGSDGSANSRNRKRNIHGILNGISWGVLMPIGVIMARYLKVFKFADPAWFYLHVGCQSSAYIIGVAGWATGLQLGSDSPGIVYHTHRTLGILLFCFATLQVFALLLRPNKDHKYRFYWNIYHHLIGYTTIVLSIVNIFEGFSILGREKNWRSAYIGILIFLGASAAILEAVTWFIVIKRKKKTEKYGHSVNGANGSNGVNGYGSRTQPVV
ncbi:Cytochrom_B561 domain-containing protein/DUF568 domain-containing protein [Cephalotus follicularis]|uniref:Cytochrome b561 and DOMON domain-containing protein n=1 Tax=Cephalotus follicularis TaxID=3775 RepID=A0A1Q3C3C7_CEPFO|nr:Cytochrom_B561 domain-containing protein/DUF568 domain-containing protein [Cephalotus follicularis]